MKKSDTKGFLKPSSLYINLSMKLTVLFVLVSVLSIEASVYSQKSKVTIDLEEVELKEVLETVESLTDLKFFYNNKKVNTSNLVSIKVVNRPVSEVLEILFKDTGITYVLRKKQIILKPGSNGNISPKITKHGDSIGEQTVQQTISGTVTDSDNLPLVGANVIEKGTVNGTQTDFDGNFTLEISEGATLVVSYIGFAAKEVKVDGQSQLSITLEEDAAGLDEVVVVGYGTQKKSDLTGAISSVSGEDLAKTPAANLLDQAQGRLAGVDIVRSNGTPGSDFQITIRGNRSITAGNGPLYVVDGIPTNTSISDFNPADIESLEVLKDASAVAIYGSRGANGVILITTKRGKKGKPTITYNTYYGVKTPVENIDVMSSQEFIEYNRIANGLDPNDSSQDATFQNVGPIGVQNLAAGVDTDWLGFYLQNGEQKEHQLSVSGGSEKINYYISGSYYNETGNVRQTDFERWSLRTNLDAQLSAKTKVGVSLTASHDTRNQFPNRPFRASIQYSPLFEPFDEDGNIIAFPNPEDNLQASPLLEYAPNQTVDETERYRFFSNIFGVYNFTDHLSYRLNVGIDFSTSRRGRFSGDYDNTTSTGSLNNENILSYTVENILTFDKEFGEHNLNVVGLLSTQSSTTNRSNLSARGIPITRSTFNALGTADEITDIGSDLIEWDLLSYMTRVNYRFKDKYLFTGSIRADGSSRLSDGNKWAYFPAFSAAWILSKESFFNIPTISFLKLRVGYGEVGNTAIEPYRTLGGLDRSTYAFGEEGAFGYINGEEIANPDLSWEISKTTNLGLDFGLLNGKLSGTLELYDTRTSDLLLARLVPATSGFNRVLENVGSTRNRGLEFSMSANILADRKDFNWNVGFNVFTNKEEITELFAGQTENVGNGWFVGSPVQVWYDYKFDGIYQPGDDNIPEGSQAGDIRIADVNGRDENQALTNLPDGELNPGDDRTILGSTRPDWSGGISNDFSYKGFDFSFLVNIRQGQMIQSEFHDFSGNNWQGRYNALDLNYWTPNNPSNQYPQPDVTRTPLYWESLRYFDGSFVKIKNITLGYDMAKWIDKSGTFSTFRVYLNAVNPIIFSKFDVADPETSNGVVGWNNPLTSRTFILGLNLKF